MNENDLFDALSMIDPKYINEAAYELQPQNTDNTEAKVVDITSACRKNRTRKILLTVLPSVAAILLIVGVAIPAIMRVSGSKASAPMAEASAPVGDMAEEAAADSEAAPEADSATAPEADFAAEPQADLAEAPADNTAESAGTYGPADEAPAVAEAEDIAKNENAAEAEPAANTLTAESAAESEPVAEAAEAEEAAYDYIEEAVYENGKLTLTIPDLKPEDAKDMGYTISRFTENGKDIVLSEGTFEKAVYKDGSYTLDISKLELIKGTYYINIADSSAEFSVQ